MDMTRIFVLNKSIVIPQFDSISYLNAIYALWQHKIRLDKNTPLFRSRKFINHAW